MVCARVEEWLGVGGRGCGIIAEGDIKLGGHITRTAHSRPIPTTPTTIAHITHSIAILHIIIPMQISHIELSTALILITAIAITTTINRAEVRIRSWVRYRAWAVLGTVEGDDWSVCVGCCCCCGWSGGGIGGGLLLKLLWGLDWVECGGWGWGAGLFFCQAWWLELLKVVWLCLADYLWLLLWLLLWLRWLLLELDRRWMYLRLYLYLGLA